VYFNFKSLNLLNSRFFFPEQIFNYLCIDDLDLIYEFLFHNEDKHFLSLAQLFIFFYVFGFFFSRLSAEKPYVFLFET